MRGNGAIMTLLIEDLKTPLRIDEHGTIRVGRTRVTLDTVIGMFNAGSSPEQIAHSFRKLSLDEVYLTLGYYLRQKESVDAYLQSREVSADELRKKIEAHCPPHGLRERLLERQRAIQVAARNSVDV